MAEMRPIVLQGGARSGLCRVFGIRGGLVLATFLGGLGSACAPEQDEVLHPQPALSLLQDSPSFYIGASDSVSILTLVDDWLTTKDALQIGAATDPLDEVFGHLVDAAITEEGYVALLDDHNNSLRLFNTRGELIVEGGGRGFGPGEFRSPRSITNGKNSDFFIIDRMGRVSHLLLDGDSIVIGNGFQVRGDLFDGCRSGDRIYLHGKMPGERELIHVFTLEGNHISSFAEIYYSTNPVVNYQLSQGWISCLDNGGVAFASRALPHVLAFDSTGSIQWRAEIEDFEHLDVVEMPNGAVRVGGADTKYDLISSLAATPLGKGLFVQVTRHVRDEREVVRSYLIDPMQKESVVLHDLASAILTVGDAHLLLAEDIPYPRVFKANRRGVQ